MKTYRLCELGELKNGLNFEKRNIINPCKIIGVGDFANNVYPNYEKLATIERKLVSNDFFLKEDDIVFVRSNGNKTLVGRTMLIKDIQEEITYSGFCIRFRVNCKDVYPEYLFYALRSPYCRKQYSYSQQTNITNLSQGILGNVIVKLPSLSEQKRIARILSNIDKKIMNNLKINDNLEQQLQILFDYWFKQFDFPNENNEPYKCSGGKMYWDSVYKRNIPIGWEILKFDDLVATPPKTPSIMAPDYKNIGLYPIIDQASSYITGRTDDIFYVYPNEDDCVVFGDVTKVFKYINFPFAKGTDGTKIIRSINNRIPALILYYLIKDAKLPNKGFARYYSLLREIYVLVPSSDVSEKFIVATKPIVSKIRANLEENYKLQNTRDWLLPMLMNGQATIDD